jgi:hypothetical protein
VSRTALKLPPLLEALTDETIKEHLRSLGERVRDIIGLGLLAARQSGDLKPISTAHDIAVRLFEADNATYFSVVTGGNELWQSLACRSGCNFCCHLFVEVTPVEAIALWRGLQAETQAARRAAIAAAAPSVAGLTPDRRRAAHLPCALLAEGACSVYERRPFACRGLYSTSAAACERALLAPEGAAVPPVRSPAVPRALAAVIGSGINAAAADLDLQHDTLELTAALALLLDDPDAASRWLAGERVFAPGLRKFDLAALRP